MRATSTRSRTDELGIPDAYEAYRRAAAEGLLTSHVTAALWWDRTRGLAQLETC